MIHAANPAVLFFKAVYSYLTLAIAIAINVACRRRVIWRLLALKTLNLSHSFRISKSLHDYAKPSHQVTPFDNAKSKLSTWKSKKASECLLKTLWA